MRRNICSLRSFTYWLVATHRRSITLLYKHRIHSLKVLYPRPAETVETFSDKDLQNLATLQVFQSVSHKCKNLFLRSCPKVFIRFLCECTINLLKRNLRKHKKTSCGKTSKRRSTIVSKTYNFEAKKRHSGVRKRITAHESCYSSLHLPFVLIWSSWAVCPLSCFWIQQPSGLQSRNFQSINLHKIPRTKSIHLKRR